jgi:hypothetical protein
LCAVQNFPRWRMYNCFDCHSEFGYERRMTVADNSWLEQSDFVMTSEVEERARKLYKHILEIAHRHFQRFTISDPPPHLLDYRLNQLLMHAIWYELFLLFSPQDINVDLAVMMNMAGFGFYGVTMSPCGYCGEGYKELE